MIIPPGTVHRLLEIALPARRMQRYNLVIPILPHLPSARSVLSGFYSTPSSISHLSLAILAFVIMTYLTLQYLQGAQAGKPWILLLGFIFFIFLFAITMFLDTVSLPEERLFFLYLENPILAIDLILFIKFCDLFPQPNQHNWLADIFLTATGLYTAFEIGYSIFRYYALSHGDVVFRPMWADFIFAIILTFPFILLLRQTLLADSRPIAWGRKLFNPEGRDANAARNMAGIYILVILLGLANLTRGQNQLYDGIFDLTFSIGLLSALWLFGYVYVTSQPVEISFIVKIIGGDLTLLLVLTGVTGWVMMPGFLDIYHSENPLSNSSLRFTPNTEGGYNITTIPYQFETDLGTRLPIKSSANNRSYELDFPFPLYGEKYSSVFITNFGLIRMDDDLTYSNLELNYGNFPGLFPLLVALAPDAPGAGIYARTQDDRLIVTWNSIPVEAHPEMVLTFQAVLYRDGRFDFIYKDIPRKWKTIPAEAPYDNIWARGVTPGGFAPPKLVQDLADSTTSDRQGILQDYYLGFRSALHSFIFPLFWLVFSAALVLFGLIPIVIHYSIVCPLHQLMAGVRLVDQGNLDVVIPVRHYDEFGQLANSFNRMIAWLKSFVNGLEIMVAERTTELEKSNLLLQKEISDRQASQAQVIEQQRALAIMDERMRFSRNLHDGLGQVLSSITLQTVAAQNLLKQSEFSQANENLERVIGLSREASADLRNLILWLREPQKPAAGLISSLENLLQEFSAQSGVQVHLSLPSEHPLPVLATDVETQLLKIIQEALVNVRKYAQARQVEILFSSVKHSVQVTIQDDGVGFNLDRPFSPANRHFGLAMMRERVEMIGGRLEVRSAPGKGTIIMITIPGDGQFGTGPTFKTLQDLRLLLVDNSDIFLQGLGLVLQTHEINVAGTAHDGLEAQQQARKLRPDLILMDISMPHCDGLEAARAIKAEFPEITIAILSNSESNDALLFNAIQNGASACLPKGLGAAELISALGEIARGEIRLPPAVAAKVVSAFSTIGTNDRSVRRLSSIEALHLSLLSDGASTQELLAVLQVTEKQLHAQMRHILVSLRASQTHGLPSANSNPPEFPRADD